MSIILLNAKNIKYEKVINYLLLGFEEKDKNVNMKILLKHYENELKNTFPDSDRKQKIRYFIKILSECLNENDEKKGSVLKLATNQNKDDICSICTDEYKIKDEIILLQCSHFYHKICISKWVKIKDTCPYCRCTIKTVENTIDRCSINTQIIDECVIN